MDVPLGSSSTHIAQAAQAEVQPFFRARVFPPSSLSSAPSDTFATSSLSALRSSLASAFQVFLRKPLPSGLDRYVFYRSNVTFRVSQGWKSKDGQTVVPPHVRIDLQTGGATEDEFALIHFLRLHQRSNQILEECFIQVQDEDGEFLLIEAAEELPEWIDPENADGRVWLAREQLQLIGPGREGQNGASGHGSILPIKNLRNALTALAQRSETLQFSQSLNDAAFSRLSSYPGTEWVDTAQHRTTAFLSSSSVAQVLQRQCQLIARAGQAFLGRDSRDMRVASKMQTFGPTVGITEAGPTSSASKPGLLVPLSLPRRLYIQLLSVRFLPPKSFSSPYRERISQYYEDLDSVQAAGPGLSAASKAQQERLDEGRRWDLGCKLSVGLEMAYWNDRERFASQRRSRAGLFDTSQPADRQQLDPRSDPGYEHFINKLERLGYFQNEVRDSQKWKELEATAVSDWWKTRSSGVPDTASDDQGDDAGTEDLEWVESIRDVLATSNAGTVASLNPSGLASILSQEQSDSWLYETGDSFLDGDQSSVGDGQEAAEREATQKLSDFAARVEKFIEGKGAVEGAVIDESEDSGESSDDEEEADMDLDGEVQQDEDDETVILEARRRLGELSAEARADRLKALLPGLGEQVAWQTDDDVSARQALDEQLKAMAEEPSQPAAPVDVRANPPRDAASGRVVNAKEATLLTKKKASQTAALSSSDLRDSLQAQAKAYRSSTISSHFDGAESWQLEDSDNDSEAGLDENGRPETKEQRRERARVLDLDPSDDEKEDEAEEPAGEMEEIDAEKDEEEEMEEFVDFARKELGLSEEQLSKIMKERKDNGRWVPGKEQTTPLPAQAAPTRSNTAAPPAPSSSFGKGFKQGFLSRPSAAPTPDSVSKAKSVSFVDTTEPARSTSNPVEPAAATSPTTNSTSGVRNSSLNSFDTLMGAMDSALDAHRRSKGLPPLNREETYGGEVRAEDWALRRPGGASLGSLMKKEEEERERNEGNEAASEAKAQQNGKVKGEDDAQTPSQGEMGGAPILSAHEQVALTGSSMDEDVDEEEEEEEPLSAKDTALLDRLLKEQNQGPPSFTELVDSAGLRAPNNGNGIGQSSKGVAPKISEISADLQDEEGDEDEDGDEEMLPDLAIEGDADDAEEGNGAAVSNLLESWRAQGGAAGPMGTLAGGMGFGSRAPR
ncbi:SGT1-domain-containing protein [Microstroma glucosiphilum]|uniref:SGT1-domain-containing protein n=1 Tax=Pseudomicrostroma glucosiphilum TaxID=1684307 RepID=A0A316UG08_9BASI|nr:SGT1-domain-containing protein [Pseudomicrostroma glucosiphilum]PWN22843.1 SGT1-domain-containing protein [Pseudomicrostroma glucosiphilum]